jgi:N-methylhydantoinase B
VTLAATQATETLDPVKFEVIRNALVEATEEMGLTLRRSAYSTNIKTRADYSCVIFDDRLQFLASNFAQASHLGSMSRMVPLAVREYGPEKLGPGDAILVNHPYLGGVHLNDIALISPAFIDGALFGYVANIAHHVDVGGGAPASIGAFQEVYQEGVIIPPVRLVEGGEVVDDIFRLVLSQIRSKHETAGDLRAQIASVNTGIRRLDALLQRYGKETVAFYADQLIEYTQRRTQLGIAALPKGVFSAEGQVDNDGFSDKPVRLCVTITIDETGVLFDFEGSDPQRRAPVNSTYSQTLSGCAYVLKCLIDPDIPANEGFYRLVRMNAPLGTVVNCKHPAAVVGGFETHTRFVDTMLKALAPAMPDRLPAGSKAMMCHAGFGDADPVSGEYYCFLETLGGGFGGRLGLDGADAVQTHGQNTENAPIEETELNYPVRVTRYELVNDSDGAGQWRGGLGLRRDYLFPDRGATFTILADRHSQGPHGLFGGFPGRVAEYILNPDSECRHLGSKTTLRVEPGDVVSYRTCGGGGYGSPLERDPELVLRDVQNRMVSVERARDVYGVALNDEGDAVHTEATKKLRESMEAAQ